MKSLGWERSAKQIFQVEKVAWDDEESELLRKEKFSQITQKKETENVGKRGDKQLLKCS